MTYIPSRLRQDQAMPEHPGLGSQYTNTTDSRRFLLKPVKEAS